MSEDEKPKKPVRGRPFVKGGKGGPGRNPNTAYQNFLRGKYKKLFYECLEKYGEMSLSEIEKELKRRDIGAIERMILDWFAGRVSKISNQDFELLAKMLGVKADSIHVDLTSSDGSMSPVENNNESLIFLNLTDSEKAEMYEKKIELLKKKKTKEKEEK